MPIFRVKSVKIYTGISVGSVTNMRYDSWGRNWSSGNSSLDVEFYKAKLWSICEWDYQVGRAKSSKESSRWTVGKLDWRNSRTDRKTSIFTDSLRIDFVRTYYADDCIFLITGFSNSSVLMQLFPCFNWKDWYDAKFYETVAADFADALVIFLWTRLMVGLSS